MAKSSNIQSNFLGGQVSARAQGRFDQPWFANAMNLSYNGLPLQEGAWTRRSGTRSIGPTCNGYARLLPFPVFPAYGNFMYELTNQKLRVVTQSSYLFDNGSAGGTAVTVSTATLANPLVFITSAATGWVAGDHIQLQFPSNYTIALEAGMRSRTLTVGTVNNSTSFNVQDEFGVDIDASAFPTGALVGASVAKIAALVTPFTTAQLPQVRGIATSFNQQIGLVMLHNRVPPQLSALSGEIPGAPGWATTVDPEVYVDPVTFIDGPYLDPMPTFANYTTWDAPKTKGGAGISNAGLTYTTPATNQHFWTATLDSVGQGFVYVEVSADSFPTTGGSPGTSWTLGVSNVAPTNLIGSYVGSAGFLQAYTSLGLGTGTYTVINTGSPVETFGTWDGLNAQGDLIGLLVDLANRRMWIRNFTTGPNGWCGSIQNANPAIPGSGVDISGLTGPLYLTFTASNMPGEPVATQVTENTGSVFFPTGTIPPGYTWYGGSFVGGSSTISAYTGIITLDVVAPNTFASTDVGRLIRMFSQPTEWNNGTTYTTGDEVTDAQGQWWQSIVPATGIYAGSNVGVTPGTFFMAQDGTSLVFWQPAPTAGVWAWGIIQSVINPQSVTVAIQTSVPGMAFNQHNGLNLTYVQLGLYCLSYYRNQPLGYPSCGVSYDGRLWLAGAFGNRFDASSSNQPFVFSPTDPWGNVIDSNAIAEVLNTNDIINFQWMFGDQQGVICGTNVEEFLISANVTGDPITATNVQAQPTTKYGGANVEPVKAGMSVIFPMALGRHVEEYLADVFSQKYTGQPLNEYSYNTTVSGVKYLVYKEDPSPVVYALLNNGTLLGCTYRRLSRFVSEKPVFNAWHVHQFAGISNVMTPGAVIEDIAVLPNANGSDKNVYLSVNVPNVGRVIEVIQPIDDESTALTAQWYVDGSTGIGPGTRQSLATGTTEDASDWCGGNMFPIAPNGGLIGDASGSSTTSIVISGLWALGAGATVTAWICGLNCGSYTVSATGTITVPYGSDPNGLLMAAFLIANDTVGTGQYNYIRVDVYNGASNQTVHVPVLVGFPYTSAGQLLRPTSAEQTKSQMGARIGKKGRGHKYGLLASNTIGLSVGQSSSRTFPMKRYNAAGVALADNVMFSGVVQDTFDDDSNYDNMMYWETSGPYPTTVVAAGLFLEVTEV